MPRGGSVLDRIELGEADEEMLEAMEEITRAYFSMMRHANLNHKEKGEAAARRLADRIIRFARFTA